MSRFLRGVVAVGAIALSPALGTGALQAQGQALELRVDFASLQNSDGNTAIALLFPGSLAMAFYMNQQFALEPTAVVTHVSTDDEDFTAWALGMFLPFYFNRDMGRTGFFVSPGLLLSKSSGSDSNVDLGLDVGYKWRLRDRISSRLALTLRDEEGADDTIIGLTWGLGFFWR
jgi:hypothetical protein